MLHEHEEMPVAEFLKVLLKVKSVEVFVCFTSYGHYFKTTKKSAEEWARGHKSTVEGCVRYDDDYSVLQIG